MPIYILDRQLPGASTEDLAGAQRAAIATSERFSAEGKPVRYIRSTFVPGDSHCMCLFEAPSAEMVREVNDSAERPYSEVREALDLTP